MRHEVKTESLVRQRGALRSLKAAEGAKIVAVNLQDSGDSRLDLIRCGPISYPISVCRS